MKGLLFFIIVALLMIGVFYFNPFNAYVSQECFRDSDCAPAECCHPNSCVQASKKPNCEGVFCTEECVPGTMDCGCGTCARVDGRCRVDFIESDVCLKR